MIISSANTANYTLQLSHASHNPADGATYYFGGVPSSIPGSTDGNFRIYIPKTGTIKAVYGNYRIATTNGTTENSTLSVRVNSTTSTTISSTVQFTTTVGSYNNAALSIPVVAGDFIEIVWLCPTWATNPVAVFNNCVVYIETT